MRDRGVWGGAGGWVSWCGYQGRRGRLGAPGALRTHCTRDADDLSNGRRAVWGLTRPQRGTDRRLRVFARGL